MRSPSNAWKRASRGLATIALLAVLASGARATWSIVVVDTKTGEVCVAGATCLGGDLSAVLPVMVPGIGVAAAQANVDASAQNRQLIQQSFLAGMTPREMLDALAQIDPGHHGRQYGIVDLLHDPITFTGVGAGFAKPDVAGIAGNLRFALQGNVLACDQVIVAAEQALLATEGDLSQRAMAAMSAARAWGGDGRCSCSFANPTNCGCPPQTGKKTCGTAFIVLARIGDTLGVCGPQTGCANGSYFLKLAEFGPPFTVDPARRLNDAYEQWRLGRRGIVDQLHTQVAQSSKRLLADGRDRLTVSIRAADLERAPIAHGGHAITLVHQGGGAPLATPGAIVDHGDGTYEVEFQAGATPGVDRWRLVVDEGGYQVALQPDVAIELVARK